MSTRLSINISNQTARTLRELADKNETSVTDIVRRAVQVYDLVNGALDKGKTVQALDRDTGEAETLNVC
jgi:hypothetical protein